MLNWGRHRQTPKKREKKREEIYEEIKAKDSLKLMTDTKLQIQRGQRTPSKIHSEEKKNILPRYIRRRAGNQRKNSEDSQRKRLLSYRENKRLITVLIRNHARRR